MININQFVHMILVLGQPPNINIEDATSKMHIIASAKHNQAEELLKAHSLGECAFIPIKDYKYLYTNSKSNKIYGIRKKYKFFGNEFTTVVLYNEALHKK